MSISSIKIALVICGLATCVAGARFLKTPFKEADLNNNGVLSIEEVYAFYDKMDTDENGVLVVTEFTGIPEEEDVPLYQRREFAPYDKLDGNWDDFFQRSSVPKLFRKIDANRNGVIEYNEWNVDL